MQRVRALQEFVRERRGGTQHGTGWDRDQGGGSSFAMILLMRALRKIPALTDAFEVTFGNDCGLFGVGLDGTGVFGLVESGIYGVHLSVDFRFQSYFPFFLILGAIQDIHEANQAFIVARAPFSKGTCRLPQNRCIVFGKTDDFTRFWHGPRARPDETDVHC